MLSSLRLRLQQHAAAQVCAPAISRRSGPVSARVQQPLGALCAAGQRGAVQGRQCLHIVRVCARPGRDLSEPTGMLWGMWAMLDLVPCLCGPPPSSRLLA